MLKSFEKMPLHAFRLRRVICSATFVLACFGMTVAGFSFSSDVLANGDPAAPSMKSYHSDLACESCHAAKNPTASPSCETCLTCHGDKKKLVDATKTLPMNPHVSPHWGTNADCSFCHKEHSESRNVCAYCHTKLDKAMP